MNTIIVVSVVGAGLIGGVMLERKLAEEEKTLSAKLVGDSLFHGTRIIGIATILYVGIKIIGWFL